MARFIAIIDIGKTNAKVAIVDSGNWREVAVRTTPNHVLDTAPYPHFDIDGIWSFIISALRDLNQTHEISAISITTHGASAVLLNQAGGLAMPMLDYEFEGPDDLANAYDLIRPPFEETGSPRLAGGLNLGAQLYWQQEMFPELFSKVETIVTYPQYWTFRLTGQLTTEVTSLGCHTDLWNPWQSEFSSMARKNHWADLFAPLRKADDIIANVQPEIADLCGLSHNVSVVCGLHDSNASLYPHLISHKAPFSVVSSGTWTISMVVGGHAITPDQARDTLVNVNALGEPVPSARFMGGREFDILMDGRNGDHTAEDRSKIINGDIMISPSVENEFGPFQGRDMAWHGVAPENDGEHYVAISFYLALMTATCLALIGADGPTLVEGPFAKNELYLEMLAIATKRDVIVSNTSATGTSIGAAKLLKSAEIDQAHTGSQSNRKIKYADNSPLEAYADKWKAIMRAH